MTDYKHPPLSATKVDLYLSNLHSVKLSLDLFEIIEA